MVTLLILSCDVQPDGQYNPIRCDAVRRPGTLSVFNDLEIL